MNGVLWCACLRQLTRAKCSRNKRNQNNFKRIKFYVTIFIAYTTQPLLINSNDKTQNNIANNRRTNLCNFMLYQCTGCQYKMHIRNGKRAPMSAIGHAGLSAFTLNFSCCCFFIALIISIQIIHMDLLLINIHPMHSTYTHVCSVSERLMLSQIVINRLCRQCSKPMITMTINTILSTGS